MRAGVASPYTGTLRTLRSRYANIPSTPPEYGDLGTELAILGSVADNAP